MGIDRQTLAFHLRDFLNDTISLEDIYRWALAVAVGLDFTALREQDPLAYQVIQDIIKLQEDPARAPSRLTMEYYRQCLAGEQEYVPLVVKESRASKMLAAASKIIFAIVLFVLRLYVFIFGLSMFIINYLLLRSPAIFKSSENLQFYLSSIDILPRDAFYAFINDIVMRPEFSIITEILRPQNEMLQIPIVHLVYAFLILLPPGFVARNIVFTISFPLLLLGVFYYWFLAWDMSAKIAFAFMFGRIFSCLLLSPITGIPATLALFLLIIKTLELRKKGELEF